MRRDESAIAAAFDALGIKISLNSLLPLFATSEIRVLTQSKNSAAPGGRASPEAEEYEN